MFCPNCGRPIAEDDRFCPNCGAVTNAQSTLDQSRPISEMSHSQSSDSETSYRLYNPLDKQGVSPDLQSFDSSWNRQTFDDRQSGDSSYGQQTSYSQQSSYDQQSSFGYSPSYQPAGNAYGTDGYKDYPMKWHKFLVYFALWLGVAMNAYRGVQCLEGKQYDSSGLGARLVYSVLPSMKTADKLLGIALIVLAVVGGIAAVRLLKLRAGAPGWLTALYAANLAVGIGYIIMVISAVSGYKVDTTELIEQSVLSTLISLIMIVINRIYYKKRADLFVN